MKYLPLFISIFYCISLNGQEIRMFEYKWLDHPDQYSPKLEECFSYKEIPEYDVNVLPRWSEILVNGYAQHKIANGHQWRGGITNRAVLRIDVVFTKYPFEKKDWITDYYWLLSNRLLELFKLDPDLNSKNIEWNMILQTSCRNEDETRELFHGIVIFYKLLNPAEEVSSNSEGRYFNDTSATQAPDNNWDDYFESPKTTAPQGQNQYRKTKKKQKARKDPECPDFSNKRRRLFKKRRS